MSLQIHTRMLPINTKAPTTTKRESTPQYVLSISRTEKTTTSQRSSHRESVFDYHCPI